jgi:hypothetical protein
VAALMPIFLSLAVFPGWHHALITAGIYFAMELIVSNFVEPLLYGAHVGLSPLAILVAAVFWTLIWGFPGLVLSTPLTVCLVVMGRHVPSLRFFDVLLGDEPALSPHAQYYQRLLATDHTEARQILEQYLKEKPLDDLYDSVVIPALSLAEQDRHRSELDEDTQNFIYQSTREIVEDLGELSREESVSETSGSVIERTGPIDVLCIPARDEADEIVAILLSQLLERKGHRAQSIPVGTISEILSQVAETNPTVVCISALPPFAVDHARALYAQLRSHSPGLYIAICLWHFDGDPHKATTRLKLGSAHGFFTTLPEVLQDISFRVGKIAVDAKTL